MGNAKTKELAWFVKPNPMLMRKNEYQPYILGGEKEIPTDGVLQQRAYEMIINEPSNVNHRLMYWKRRRVFGFSNKTLSLPRYAIMAIRLKGEKNIKAAQAELIKYIEDAKACDPKESKVYSLLGFLNEKIGNLEKASEAYLAGYNNVFSVGGRMLSIHDVELLALFGSFSEEHGMVGVFE
jgi:hypothetical protein